MAGHQPVRGAGEAPVREQRDVLAEPLADQRRRDLEHLSHPRPARGPLVPDHDHVSRHDRPLLDRRERLLLGLEHAGRPAMRDPPVPGQLDDAPLGRQVPAQNAQGAARLDRVFDPPHHLLTGRLDHRRRHLPERAPVHRRQLPVHEPASGQLAGDEGYATGPVHVGGVESAPRLHVGEHGRLRGDPVEVVDREVEAELACDRDEMQHPVRRAAGRHYGRGRVLECLARDDLRRAHVAANEVDRDPPALVCGVGLLRGQCRDAVQPGGAEAEELEDGRHRVRGELPAAGARARAGDRLELVQLVGRHLAGGVAADRLVDVCDGDLTSAEDAGRDRARVEDHAGDVEPPQRHYGRGVRLVAGDEAGEAVEEVASRDQLDRVGDHLPRDEAGAHALRPHRDAVGDRDRVELHRRPARLADPALGVLGELALVQIARHRLDPGGGDADQRLREVVVGEADRLQHRPGSCPVRSVGDRGAVPFGGIRAHRAILRTLDPVRRGAYPAGNGLRRPRELPLSHSRRARACALVGVPSLPPPPAS